MLLEERNSNTLIMSMATISALPLLDLLMCRWTSLNKNVSLLMTTNIACSHRLMFSSFLVFAPVALLMPYSTVEEAIDIANGTRYGLGASVFGPDQDECLKVAKQLDCGMVSINDFAVFYVSSCFLGHMSFN